MSLRYFISFLLLAGLFTCIFTKKKNEEKVKKNLNVISSKDMLKVLENSHDGQNYIIKTKFIENYKAAGGSEDIAARIFLLMNKEEDVEKISLTTVEENLEDVIMLYQNQYQDESTEKGAERNEEIEDVEIEIDEERKEERERKKKIIEEEFNRHDHLKGFVDENEDDYPDHEPMYQPAEDHILDGEFLMDNLQNKPEVEAVESYDDDVEKIRLFNEKMQEKENSRNLHDDESDHEPIYQPEDAEHYADHEPMYQPEDQGEEVYTEEETVDKDAEQDILTIVEDDDEEQYEITDDDNDDGYPDHEPIYQPEDSEMLTNVRNSKSKNNGNNVKRDEL